MDDKDFFLECELTVYNSKKELGITYERDICYLIGERLLYYLSIQRKVKSIRNQSLWVYQSYAVLHVSSSGFLN